MTMKVQTHLGNTVATMRSNDVGTSSISHHDSEHRHSQRLDLESLLTATTSTDEFGDETTEVKRDGTDNITPDNDASDFDDDDGPSLGMSHHRHNLSPQVQHFSYDPRVRVPQLFATASWYELSGSLGDLGTFLPLLTALGQARAIHVGPALVYAGLANIATGYVWDCPMPVQPMKSIAATALYAAWSAQTVTAAGMLMGVALTVLAVVPTGLTWLVGRGRHASRSGLVLGHSRVGMVASLALVGVGFRRAEYAMWCTHIGDIAILRCLKQSE